MMDAYLRQSLELLGLPVIAPEVLANDLANDLASLAAMSRAWDDAAAALMRRDLAGCDHALARLKRLSTREAGSANNAPASDR